MEGKDYVWGLENSLRLFKTRLSCYKFDSSEGYYHLDFFPAHQTFLAFCFKEKFNCYTVVPFGLSSAPFIFTKTIREMVKFWRFNSAKIVMFLDNGLGQIMISSWHAPTLSFWEIVLFQLALWLMLKNQSVFLNKILFERGFCRIVFLFPWLSQIEGLLDLKLVLISFNNDTDC